MSHLRDGIILYSLKNDSQFFVVADTLRVLGGAIHILLGPFARAMSDLDPLTDYVLYSRGVRLGMRGVTLVRLN